MKKAALREAAAKMIRNTALDDATIASITGLAAEEVTDLRRGN